MMQLAARIYMIAWCPCRISNGSHHPVQGSVRRSRWQLQERTSSWPNLAFQVLPDSFRTIHRCNVRWERETRSRDWIQNWFWRGCQLYLGLLCTWLQKQVLYDALINRYTSFGKVSIVPGSISATNTLASKTRLAYQNYESQHSKFWWNATKTTNGELTFE